MDNNPEDTYEEYSDEEVRKILKAALKTKIREDDNLPNRKEIYKALSSYMSEFLSCYRLIGYDLNGKPVNMMYYTNKLEQGALEHAFVEAIAQHMNARMGYDVEQ